MNSCLKEKILSIRCEGSDEEEVLAIEKAFSDMRSKIRKIINKPIITIKTEDVYLVEKDEIIKNEAFLYFFLKRKRIIVKYILEIKLKVNYLEI